MRANLIDKYKDEVTSFSESKNEPDWYKQVRLDSLAKADELSLPKYEKINYRSWRLDRPGVINADSEIKNDNKPQADNYIYQAGNQTLSSSLDEELSDKGVILTDIFSAMNDYPDLMKKYFMTKVTKAEDSKLTALNAAFLNSGIFLYVPRGVHINKSIQAMFVQDNSVDCDFVHHVLIVAEADSEVTYLENLVSTGSGYKNKANIVVEVIAADDSRVHFSALDQLSKDTTTYLSRRGCTGNNTRLDWAIGFMNDGDVIGDFGTDLLGEGSHTEAKVVAITTGDQVQGIDTKVTNYGQHTIGHILQHGVILQKSTLTFNGVGHIVKGARGSDAQQESRVLMLSRKARGDANPILLIDENDVTAGHAASVGRVNEDQMYYLMSRGIDEKTAQRLVIRGFLSSVISEIPEKDVRASLTQMIERKLINGQQ